MPRGGFFPRDFGNQRSLWLILKELVGVKGAP
jgi:hypothetical protein